MTARRWRGDGGQLAGLAVAVFVVLSIISATVLLAAAAQRHEIIAERDALFLRAAVSNAGVWLDSIMDRHDDADWAHLGQWAATGGFHGGGDCLKEACWAVTGAAETSEPLRVAGRGSTAAVPVRRLTVVAAIGCWDAGPPAAMTEASARSGGCRTVTAPTVLEYEARALPLYAHLVTGAGTRTAWTTPGTASQGVFYNALDGGKPAGCADDDEEDFTCAGAAALTAANADTSDDLTISPSDLSAGSCGASPYATQTWALSGHDPTLGPEQTAGNPPEDLSRANEDALYVTSAEEVAIHGSPPGPVTVVADGTVRITGPITAPKGAAVVIISGCKVVVDGPLATPAADSYKLQVTCERPRHGCLGWWDDTPETGWLTVSSGALSHTVTRTRPALGGVALTDGAEYQVRVHAYNGADRLPAAEVPGWRFTAGTSGVTGPHWPDQRPPQSGEETGAWPPAGAPDFDSGSEVNVWQNPNPPGWPRWERLGPAEDGRPRFELTWDPPAAAPAMPADAAALGWTGTGGEDIAGYETQIYTGAAPAPAGWETVPGGRGARSAVLTVPAGTTGHVDMAVRAVYDDPLSEGSPGHGWARAWPSAPTAIHSVSAVHTTAGTLTAAEITWDPPGSVRLDGVLIVAADGLWSECAEAAEADASDDCDRRRRTCDDIFDQADVPRLTVIGSVIEGAPGGVSTLADCDTTLGYDTITAGYRPAYLLPDPARWAIADTAWWPERGPSQHIWRRRCEHPP